MLCVFDVNETLLDLTGLDPLFADLAGDRAAATAVRTAWFDLMIHNALVVTAAGGYQPFGDIAADASPRSPLTTARWRPTSTVASSAR